MLDTLFALFMDLLDEPVQLLCLIGLILVLAYGLASALEFR